MLSYNILIIDKKIHAHKIINTLDTLENKTIFLDDNITTLYTTFQENNIHLIILNSNILNIDDLSKLFEQTKIDQSKIPILILKNNSLEKNRNLKNFVFDYIDIDDKELVYNKVNFCQQLYKNELEYENKIKNLLYIDNLTLLPNRIKLIKDLQDESIGINAVSIIDIKSFKQINDFFGHRIGDIVLKEIVKIINDIIRLVKDKLTLYKFSADVYCLANYGLSHKNFEEIIKYILGAIQTKIIRIDEHEIDINASAGITFSARNNKLVTADLALQTAKKQNKDYLVFYEELDNLREYEKNMLWTKKLKNALDKDNIIVYFQPLINSKTLKVDKYECLVRLYDEKEDKIVSPYFFLDISKKANQYTNITKIVIEKSFIKFENLEFEFSINVSYEDIDDKNFINFIKEKLTKYNVANRVVWEILEDETIKDYSVLINFIEEVKKLGCKVAIDDFGSGYSNFEHLLKMDVDYLKIDASLIKNIVTDENSYKVVKTVIDFANSLQIKTIAEYVENEEIFNKTKDMGVNFFQGYFFSAPIPKPELKQF